MSDIYTFSSPTLANNICELFYELKLHRYIDYRLSYDRTLDEFYLWVKDEKYLTLIFLKFPS